MRFFRFQELGISNSSYSLSEQLKFNSVFKKENGEMPKFEEIKKFINKIRKEWKVIAKISFILLILSAKVVYYVKYPSVFY